MTECKNCHADVRYNWEFCPFCGDNIDTREEDYTAGLFMGNTIYIRVKGSKKQREKVREEFEKFLTKQSQLGINDY